MMQVSRVKSMKELRELLWQGLDEEGEEKTREGSVGNSTTMKQGGGTRPRNPSGDAAGEEEQEFQSPSKRRKVLGGEVEGKEQGKECAAESVTAVGESNNARR